MLRNKLERLFDAWRREGDAAALAKVFDRTAPELLRLATHLVRDPVEAEDVLQVTYLTAIERAQSFDSARPLVPWLVGILVNQARDARRRNRRDSDLSSTREGAGGELDPAEEVAAGEFSAALVAALEELPEPYREVLRMHLTEDRRPVEIARELGRPPGTIRMQVHRGLTLLRRALPAGFAAGAAVTTLQPRGLAAVREEVLGVADGLASAAAAAGSGTTAAGSISATSWGLIAATAALAAVAWSGLADSAEERTPGSASSRAGLARAALERDDSGDGVVADERSRVAQEPSPATEPEPAGAVLLRGRILGLPTDQRAAVRLTVRGSARFAWPAEVVAVGQPDAAGEFAIDVSPLLRTAALHSSAVTFVVSADHPRYMPGEARCSSTDDFLTLDLVPAGLLRGNLRLPAAHEGPLAVAALRLIDGAPVLPPVSESLCTPDGEFELRVRTAEEHVVVAVAEGLPPLSLTGRVAPGATRMLGSATLGPGAFLEGHAVSGGRPLVGASIVARAVEGAPRGTRPLAVLGRKLFWVGDHFESVALACETGALGEFRIDGLAPASYALTVEGLAQRVPVLDGACAALSVTAPGAEIELDVALARVEVRAVDARGGAVGGRLFLGQGGVELALDLGGAVAVRPLAACDLRVEGAGYQTARLAIDAPGPGELQVERVVLARRSRVSLEFVLTAPDALAEVVLELQPVDAGGVPTGWPVAQRLVLDAGVVQVDAAVGAYRAALFAGGSSEHYDAYLLPARFPLVLDSGSRRELVALARGGRLRIAATDGAGTPLAAHCTILDSDGRATAVRFLSFRPERVRSRQGRLWAREFNDVHPNLPAGDYEVELSAPGFAAQKSWVRIERGAAALLHVELIPSAVTEEVR